MEGQARLPGTSFGFVPCLSLRCAIRKGKHTQSQRGREPRFAEKEPQAQRGWELAEGVRSLLLGWGTRMACLQGRWPFLRRLHSALQNEHSCKDPK